MQSFSFLCDVRQKLGGGHANWCQFMAADEITFEIERRKSCGVKPLIT